METEPVRGIRMNSMKPFDGMESYTCGEPVPWTADGYILIEDNGVPLAKIPTGDEMHVSIMAAILAAAAAAVVLALLTGRKRKRVRRHSRR